MNGFKRGLITGLAAILLTAGIFSCSRPENKSTESNKPGLYKNAHVLTKQEAANMPAFDFIQSNEVHLLKPTSFKVGDEFASPPIPGIIPKGIPPEEIVRISPDRKTLYVKRIPLEQMLDSASVHRLDITPPDGYLTETTSEGTKQIPYLHGSFNYKKNFKNVAIARDKKGNPLFLSGSLFIDSDVFLNAHLGRKVTSKLLEVGANSTFKTDMELYVPKPVDVDGSYNIRLTSPPYFVDVMGIPTTMQAFANLIIKANGEFSEMNEAFSDASTLDGKISYENGTWSATGDSHSKPTLSPSPIRFKVGKGEITVTINVGFNVDYGPGPLVGLTAGAYFQKEDPQKSQPWEISWGMDGHAGIDTGWLSAFIKPYQESLVSKTWSIAKGEVPKPMLALKDFFLQGDELQGISYGKLNPKFDFSGVLESIATKDQLLKYPIILSKTQLAQFKTYINNQAPSYFSSLEGLGLSLYNINNSNGNYPKVIQQTSMQFASSKQETEFLNDLPKAGSTPPGSPPEFLFAKGNLLSLMVYDSMGGEAENKIFRNSILKYLARTGSQFYFYKNGWKTTNQPMNVLP